MKHRILFVCIGNAIRSQMAEGFAKEYASDCIVPASAGVAPASHVDPNAIAMMADIGIDISEHFCKHVGAYARMEFDTIVNISGSALPKGSPKGEVVDWSVDDPVGGRMDEYRQTRDLIQKLVTHLIRDVRKRSTVPSQVASTRNDAASSASSAEPARQILDRRRRLRQS